jgi:hypothetical protein
MKILHLLSQRPEATGSGIYIQAMIRPQLKATMDPVQLVYAGKLSRAKGVPWLLRALGSLGHLPWLLHLVGGGIGEERDEVLELAAALGDRVHFWGPQPQEELARLMGQDTPRQEDEDDFVRDLADALARQILAARERPEIDRREVGEILENYSGSQVFARVEQVYLEALGHEPH